MSVPQCARIKQWEEAGQSLLVAFGSYLDLCLNLGTDSLREDADPKDLVARIDSTLEAVHIRVSDYLKESNSALALARNKLASPLYNIPEEVLSEIFLYVVFDRDNSNLKGSQRPSMKREVSHIYRRLNSLIGVCTTWRNIVMARGAFWSVIPMVSNSSKVTGAPLDLILQRAGGNAVHLALECDEGFLPKEVTRILAEYGSRFRAINFTMDDEELTRNTTTELLKHITPGTLTDLSIQFSESPNMAYDLPLESDYVVLRDSPQQTSFANLTRSLETFRIYGTQFHWDSMVFSSRLAELRIEQVALGYDDAIFSFIQALASAPGLRDLKIISVSTFRRRYSSGSQAPSSPITLPNLETLLLEDLYLNTLEHLLPMIPAGSYDLTLYPTHSSVSINMLYDEETDDGIDDNETTDFEGLCRILDRVPVNTLVLNNFPHSTWIKGAKLRRLLRSMPSLKTLKLHNWSFGNDTWKWKHLTKNQSTQTPLDEGPFPALENIQLTSAKLYTRGGFQNMATSHPLRRIIIGGTIDVVHPDGTRRQKPLGESTSIVKWLKENVPDVHLVGSDYHPPEFDSNVWRLW